MKRTLALTMGLLIALLALTGCEIGEAFPTPVPPFEALPSIATPEPTSTPLPPLSPRLLSQSPAPGDELALDGAIELVFDQPMDRASVEGAISISPAVAGRFEWLSDEAVRFTPETGVWERDRIFSVAVDTTAQAATELALAREIGFRFWTVGYLVVTDVIPRPDSENVSPESHITIVFNRPVVPLAAIQDQAGLPQPLSLTPDVAGQGVWINTSVYRFTPDERLMAGAVYTATVDADLAAAGAVLADGYQWSFTTESPTVVTVTPAPGSSLTDPAIQIALEFNQEMDPESVEERFAVVETATDEAVAGEISWEERTLRFAPAEPLERGGEYAIVLDAGARVAQGDAEIGEDSVWQFTVAPRAEVLFTNPSQNATGVDPWQSLQIGFAAPMDLQSVEGALTITPTVRAFPYWQNDDTELFLGAALRHSTQYTITIPATALDRYGEPLAREHVLTFATRPMEPSLHLLTQGIVGVYNAYADSSLTVRHVNLSRVNLELYTLTPAELVTLTHEGIWPHGDGYTPRAQNRIASWSERAGGPLNAAGALVTRLAPGLPRPLAAGIYMLRATAPEIARPEYHILVVTTMNVTLKSAPDQALVWVTDLRSGKPLANVDVLLYDAAGREAGSGRTNADGIVSLAAPDQARWEMITVVARNGEAVGVASNVWNEGIGPWMFGLPMAWEIQAYTAYFYTERRIYRPGQTVYFKGWLRADDDADYSLPPTDQPVSVTLIDSQGREIWQDTLTINDMGAVDGRLVLGDAAPLGPYALMFRFAEQYFQATFQVAEYRKPEFLVTVSADQAEVVAGEPLVASVAAEYLFGGGLSDAKVVWRVFGSPYWFDRYQGEGYHSFGDDDMPGRAPALDLGLLAEGVGRTDAQGRLSVDIPTALQGYSSRLLTIEMTVTDINYQEVTGRTAVIAHRGGLYIGLSAESYVGTAGQPMGIGVLTVDTQGVPLARQTVDVVAARYEWFSVQQRGEDGSFYWENQVRTTPVYTETVRTDASGRARLTFSPPEGGTYKVSAQAQDGAGNEVRSGLFVWVSDTELINWGQENNNRITLVADKKSYVPGETASILIPSPFDGPTTALLTIERGGILEHRLIELETNSDLLSLPILPEYAPNVFVSVVLVRGMGEDGRGPDFRLGYVMLPVSPEQHELEVTITPDREGAYQPRSEATFTILVTDYRGRPVQAEVAVQMVDLAVETLVGGEPPDIVDAFYRERGLAVTTALSLARRRPSEEPPADEDGKGGGGGEGELGLRVEFPDTALWEPTVRTGPDGTATVSVTLPDNLTTWRVTAQAITAETQVGRGQADIVSNLEVMIRPMAPRFVVIGDELTLGAVLHNNTDQDIEIETQLTAVGLTIQGGQQSIEVAAGERQVVQWPVVVAPGSEVVLTYSAQGGGHRDAVRITLPVYHASAPEVVGTSGVVEEQIIEAIRLPEQAIPQQGGLTVLLEPSLAAVMREGLDYLEAFPHDCIEQTVSRFLPNVATFTVLRELGIEDRDLAARLPQQVGIALQRLYTLQRHDGGWGWWADDESSPLITAYVLYGMAEARDAGFVVDAQSLDRAAEYLVNWLDQTRPVTQDHWDTRAAALYALAEAGQGDLGRTVALFEARNRLSLFAKAYLGMTLHLLEPDEPARLGALENELLDAALMSATGMHWQEPQPSPWQMSTDTRTTAMVLRALLWMNPEQPLLPQAVRWLTMARSSGRWETTQENVWAILALTDFMAVTGELEADYEYSLTVDGAEKAAGRASPATLNRPVTVNVPMEELTLGRDSHVLMERRPAGALGQLYYSIFLQYFMPIEQIRALNRGIIVNREYTLDGRPNEPVTAARVNDIVNVRLTLIAPRDVYFLVVEDPFPAGCEPMDPALAITPRLDEQQAGLTPVMDPAWFEDWWFTHWPTHTELRDEKLALFATQLARGTYEYTYQLRCTTPGLFRVIPALAFQMYEPDVFGRTEGSLFEVQP